MTDDSYHMPMCIGIGIGISIGKIFSSVLGIKSIGKSGIGPPLFKIFTNTCDYIPSSHVIILNIKLVIA